MPCWLQQIPVLQFELTVIIILRAEYKFEILLGAFSSFMSDVTPNFKKTGIMGKGKNIVTKHDATICGRKNTARVMESVSTI